MPPKTNNKHTLVADHQDFKSVVMHNPKVKHHIVNRTRIQEKTTKTVNHMSNYIGADKLRKLDNVTGADTKHKKVSKSFSIAMQKARGGKKMSQLDLARATNQPVSVIKDYESGKAIPCGQVTNKLNRVLGMILPSTK